MCRTIQKINGHFPLNTVKSVLRERRMVLNSAVWLLTLIVLMWRIG